MLSVAASTEAATAYSTDKLEYIANKINLSQLLNIDSLKANEYCDSIPYGKNRPLRVIKNYLGEISHIGYYLFDLPEMEKSGYYNIALFIERLVLETDFGFKPKSLVDSLVYDQISIDEGSPILFQRIQRETPVSINYIPMRMCQISWDFGDKRLSISFPMNYELLLGADGIELENRLQNNINKVEACRNDTLFVRRNLNGQYSSNQLRITNQCYFLSELIRSDIYYYESIDGNILLSDTLMRTKSITNMIITGLSEETIPVELSIDKYGYKREYLQTTLSQMINFFRKEGCDIFFGIKKKKTDKIEGTIFAVNENYCYDHVISVSIPIDILENPLSGISAILFPYIPNHKMKQKFYQDHLNELYQ